MMLKFCFFTLFEWMLAHLSKKCCEKFKKKKTIIINHRIWFHKKKNFSNKHKRHCFDTYNLFESNGITHHSLDEFFIFGTERNTNGVT